MQNVCVFCGSSAGKDPVFMASAKALGEAIAEAIKTGSLWPLQRL